MAGRRRTPPNTPDPYTDFDDLEGPNPDTGLHPADRTWPRRWQAPFLRSLSLIPDVTGACQVAQISRGVVYTARERDKRFADAWDEALDLCRDVFQRTLHQWATTGLPVRSTRTVTKSQVDAAGKVEFTRTETYETVGSERSAQLAQMWARAWWPDRFAPPIRAELTGADGGPVRIETLDKLDREIAELSETLAARARVAGQQPAEVEA